MEMKNKRRTHFAALIAAVAAVILAFSGTGFASTTPDSENNSKRLYLNQGVESPFVKVVEAVRDSVVYISGVYEVETRMPRYYGEKKYKGPGAGSGFIFKRQGRKVYILTNNHVIEKARTIEVTLPDQTRYRAEVAGCDPKSDLAVIYIETDRKVKIARLGDSEKVKVGAWAIAIGNPLPGILSRKDRRHLINFNDRSVTVGVVSAKGRSCLNFGPEAETPVFQDYIQTDAAINLGNSGGPLFDIHGQAIGVNSAMQSRSPFGVNSGIGFAIPINLAKKIANDLIKHGRVIRAYLGIIPQEIDEDLAEALNLGSTEGVLVARVTDDTPAGKAGLKKGDIITEFDGQKVTGLNKFRMMVADARVGKKVKLVVLRKGKEKTLLAELKEYPEKELVTPTRVPVSAHWLGIKVKKKGNEGLVVVGIEEYSPAYRSRLRKGDIILEVSGETVKDWEDYKEISKKLKDKKHIVFYVKRGKKNLYVGIINY